MKTLGRVYWYLAALMLLFVLIGATGCNIPRIKAGKAMVVAPKDAGTPARLDQGDERVVMPLPKNTRVVMTEIAAVPATVDTPARPAQTVTTFDFSEPSSFERDASKLFATTGTVDTTVAMKRIDSEAKRPLLICACGAVVVGFAFMFFKWPMAAVLSWCAAGAFFAAWKVADISPWIGALFLTAAVFGFAFYKRAEWDANGDFIPDRFQKSK